MEPFVYEALPVRVIFGSGTVAQLAAEADRLGVRRVLVLSTPGRGEGQANEIAALLGERSAGVHAGAVMHTPVAVTERALQIVRERAADAVVAYGGGSTTGLDRGTGVLAADAGQHLPDVRVLAVEGRAALAEMPPQARQAPLD